LFFILNEFSALHQHVLRLYSVLFLFDHQNYTSTCEYYPINESAICVLQGEIQQLLLVDDPQAAADYCQDYIPDCDSPLPYRTQSLDPEEVSDFSVSVASSKTPSFLVIR